MTTVSQVSAIGRQQVKDYVDRFINAYLSVNPRPAGSAAPGRDAQALDLNVLATLRPECRLDDIEQG